jgi:DNA polymerase elongation subunit (family B)
MALTFKPKREVQEYIDYNHNSLLDGHLEHELVFEKKLTKLIRDYANKTADVKYAEKLIKRGLMQEKGAIYFKYGYVSDKKAVCINEFDDTTLSGRKYFWKNHVDGDVKELMSIVYPVKYAALDDFF